jgi:hypothetical protein
MGRVHFFGGIPTAAGRPFSLRLRLHQKVAAKLSCMGSPCGQVTPFESEAV